MARTRALARAVQAYLPVAFAVVIVACDDDELEPCDARQVRCGEDCAWLEGSNSHCGECGHQCQPLENCQNGACVCESSFVELAYCDGVCTDIGNDPQHCGRCSDVCPADEPNCHAGVCTACPMNECDGQCTDSRRDRRNCGGCGVVCPDGWVCLGQCIEPSSEECDPACDLDAGFLCCAAGADRSVCAHIEDADHYCGDCFLDCGGAPCSQGFCVQD